MKVVIVTGGTVADGYRVTTTLDGQKPIDIVLVSGDPGVPAIAAAWARENGISVEQFERDKPQKGEGYRAARFKRRKQIFAMLERALQLKADNHQVSVIAFPGTAPTLDLVAWAKERGLFVVEHCR